MQGLSGPAVAIALGGAHSCAIIQGGTVMCWGLNSDGQLGNGSQTDAHLPVAIPGLTGVTQVSAGEVHTCAITNGRVACWGSNSNADGLQAGQIGNNSITDQLTPLIVL